MKVQVQAVNFNADKELILLIEEKVKSLLKFYDHIIDAQVHLKVQKTSEKENKNLEIKLGIPGDDLVVKKTSNSFEDALLQAVTSLKKTLIKRKGKQREKHK
jgi:putative sigma-54 modulation protein